MKYDSSSHMEDEITRALSRQVDWYEEQAQRCITNTERTHWVNRGRAVKEALDEWNSLHPE